MDREQSSPANKKGYTRTSSKYRNILLTTTKQKYNEWKALQFLKEHGRYERYINEKVVFLINKGFKYFPKEIFYLKELISLNLYKNQITHIPKEICYLKGLERLDLNNNQISHIPKEISYLKELKALHLDNNQITHIPKKIFHLKNNLKILCIQNNPLEQQTKEDIQELLPNTEVEI